MTAVAELASATSTDRKLLEGANVVNKDVHHAKLIAEAEQEMESGWMERDRCDLIGEVPDNIKRLCVVIPAMDN